MVRWILAAALLSSGCYAEMIAGMYPVVDGQDVADSAFSWGVVVGAYIEPDPVHVGVGFGGQLLNAEHTVANHPPALQVHHHVGLNGRLELKVADLTPDGMGGLWASGSFTWTQSDEIVLIDPSHVDHDETPHAGWSWAAFAGPAAKGWWGHTGVRFAIGPAVMSTVSDTFGTTRAWGGQVRLTFLGVPNADNNPTDWGGLFHRGVAATQADHDDAEMAREAERRQIRLQCQHDPNCVGVREVDEDDWD